MKIWAAYQQVKQFEHMEFRTKLQCTWAYCRFYIVHRGIDDLRKFANCYSQAGHRRNKKVHELLLIDANALEERLNRIKEVCDNALSS